MARLMLIIIPVIMFLGTILWCFRGFLRSILMALGIYNPEDDDE